MMSTHPEVLWAQRSNAKDAAKNVLFITVKIPDAKNYKIDLTSTKLNIVSDSDDSNDHYKLDLEFFDSIDTEHSGYKINGNQIYFNIRKAKAQEEYWPRLIKEKLKVHYIKTDFDKWVDEDEQEEALEGGADPEGFDLASMMAQQGGAGGFDPSQFDPSQFGGAGGFDPSQFDGLDDVGGQANEEDFSSSEDEEERKTEEADADLDSVN